MRYANPPLQLGKRNPVIAIQCRVAHVLHRAFIDLQGGIGAALLQQHFGMRQRGGKRLRCTKMAAHRPLKCRSGSTQVAQLQMAEPNQVFGLTHYRAFRIVKCLGVAQQTNRFPILVFAMRVVESGIRQRSDDLVPLLHRQTSGEQQSLSFVRRFGAIFDKALRQASGS